MVAAQSFLFLVVTLITVSCDVVKRDVKVIPWPNCSEYQKDCDTAKQNGSIVVYAKAVSANDNLFYAFSTIGMPTIIFAHVEGANADMKFNWNKLINESSLEDAITITGTIKYKFGLAFTKFIEYNDTKDSADLTAEEKLQLDEVHWNIKEFNSFLWVLDYNETFPNKFVLNASSVNNREQVNNTWSLSFSFSVQKDEGRATELPSLKYGANETLMDFIIDNYRPEFVQSRFAVEAVLVSESTSAMSIETTDSIDDEYSPGVFQIVNWLTNPSDQPNSGFFQWKPVCYNSDARSRSTGTKVKNYDLSGLENRNNVTKLLNSSIIVSLFKEDLYNDKLVTVRTTNISFGLSEDGFYDQTNYTAWSAAIGYGTPPTDTISLTVIVIISAGLGLPVIILIFGGVYTCVKKSKSKRSQYENLDSVSRNQLLVN